jgi:hypothetical protein
VRPAKRITLLTQPACSLCDHAHEILTNVCADYSIELHELALASPEGRTLAERTGMMFAPGVVIDGELFSYGRLSERKLRRQLDQNHRPITQSG